MARNKCHLAAQTGKGLAQLAANRPCPHHQQTQWQRLERKDLHIRQIARLAQTRQIGDSRMRTCGDDKGTRFEGAAINAELLAIAKLAITIDHLNPQLRKALG